MNPNPTDQLMKPILLVLVLTSLSNSGLAAQPDGKPARTPVAQSDVPLSEEQLREVASQRSKDVPLSEEQLREVASLRTKALARQRRHIMNCDSGHLARYPDALKPGEPVDHEKLLSWRFFGHETTQVDTISLCTGGVGWGYFDHRTRIGGMLADAADIQGEGADLQMSRMVLVRNLFAEGTDHMEIIAKWFRASGKEFFWSLRMNDMHDAWGGRSISEFKQQRSEWLVGSAERQPAHGKWTAWDYGQPEVREMVFRLVEETCLNYDLDGIELDFWRFPLLFRKVAEGGVAGDEDRAVITDLMRRIRDVANRVSLERGRAVLVAVRVPDSVGYCKDIGIDLETWLKTDLVDIFIPGGDFRLNEWQYSVDLARRHGVKVFPSLEISRLGNHRKNSRSDPARLQRESLAGYAARAANVWNAGADGIHSFNMSWSRADDPRFNTLGSPETLRGVDKLFFANFEAREHYASRYVSSGEQYIRIERLTPDRPRALAPGKTETVQIYFGEEIAWLESCRPAPVLAAHLTVSGIKDAADLSVKLNGTELSNGSREDDGLRYPLQPTMLRNGLNEFQISSPHADGKSLLSDLFISLHHPGNALHAAETVTIPVSAWRGAAGQGKVSSTGVVTVERDPGGESEALAIAAAETAGSGFYVFSGKARPVSASADGAAAILAYDGSGTRLREWKAPRLEGGPDWRDFSVRLHAPEEAARFELILSAAAGKAEFKDLKLEKTTWIEGRAVDAPKLEFWINMDYYDNVYYCKRLGLENYGEAEIADYFATCRKKGVFGVHWRVSACGQMMYPSKVATPFPGRTKKEQLDTQQALFARNLTAFDPLAIAVREAKKNGIEIYIWMTLADEGYNHPVIGDLLFSEFQLDHPHTMLLDRESEPLKGTICYNEPEAFQYRIDIVKELLAYGADGLYLCTRTHSWSFGRDEGDKYGFNPAVVAEYKKRHGVDILTEDFHIEAWRGIRGEAFERLIAEIANLAHAADQKVRLGAASPTAFSGGPFGANWGNMPVDWQRYLREGWVDSMVSGGNVIWPFNAGGEINRFRAVAKPGQKLYFWAEMNNWREGGQYPPEHMLRQAEFFAFFGANGGIYHESLNLESADGLKNYFIPLTQFYSKMNAGLAHND